jgi:NADPH2:quinone reductase
MPRAIRIRRTGGPEVMTLEDVGSETPGPGQALIQQRAIGVNFIDTYHRSGLYPVPSLPSGIGVEAAGVVLSVGSGVTNVKAGDRVAYATGAPGAYAEQRVMPAERLISLPDSVDDERAAAILMKAMTVEVLMRAFPIHAGDSVLVHAAAGGVGVLACQWLSSLGVRVIGTAGSPEKVELARRSGAAEVIDYSRDNFVDRVKALTSGHGVRVAYDGVGRATVPGSLKCLSTRGALVVYGNASGKPDPIDVSELAKGSLTVTRPVLFQYIATREELVASAGRVLDALTGGMITSQIGQRFPLAEAARAHASLEARATTGATLLLPD